MLFKADAEADFAVEEEEEEPYLLKCTVYVCLLQCPTCLVFFLKDKLKESHSAPSLHNEDTSS